MEKNKKTNVVLMFEIDSINTKVRDLIDENKFSKNAAQELLLANAVLRKAKKIMGVSN